MAGWVDAVGAEAGIGGSAGLLVDATAARAPLPLGVATAGVLFVAGPETDRALKRCWPHRMPAPHAPCACSRTRHLPPLLIGTRGGGSGLGTLTTILVTPLVTGRDGAYTVFVVGFCCAAWEAGAGTDAGKVTDTGSSVLAESLDRSRDRSARSTRGRSSAVTFCPTFFTIILVLTPLGGEGRDAACTATPAAEADLALDTSPATFASSGFSTALSTALPTSFAPGLAVSVTAGLEARVTADFAAGFPIPAGPMVDFAVVFVARVAGGFAAGF